MEGVHGRMLCHVDVCGCIYVNGAVGTCPVDQGKNLIR